MDSGGVAPPASPMRTARSTVALLPNSEKILGRFFLKGATELRALVNSISYARVL